MSAVFQRFQTRPPSLEQVAQEALVPKIPKMTHLDPWTRKSNQGMKLQRNAAASLTQQELVLFFLSISDQGAMEPSALTATQVNLGQRICLMLVRSMPLESPKVLGSPKENALPFVLNTTPARCLLKSKSGST